MATGSSFTARYDADHTPPSNTEVTSEWCHASTSPYPFRSCTEKRLALPLPLPNQHYNASLQPQSHCCCPSIYLRERTHKILLQGSDVKVTCGLTHTAGSLAVRSRCVHGTITVHSGDAHDKLTVCARHTDGSPRYAHGNPTIHSWYTHGKPTIHGTLMVRPRYAHGTLTVSQLHVHGTLTVRPLYAYGTLTLRPQYTHGTFVEHSR